MGGETTGGYFPWLEWLPAAELLIVQSSGPLTLLPFDPGDYLDVTVTATDWSAGESKNGTVVFSDITESWPISLAFAAAALGGSYVTARVRNRWWPPEVGGTLRHCPIMSLIPGGTRLLPTSPTQVTTLAFRKPGRPRTAFDVG